jgi:hypothetical protein
MVANGLTTSLSLSLSFLAIVKCENMTTVHCPYDSPEQTGICRVFCSSKAIPSSTDNELKDFFGFVSQHISHIHRPTCSSKEFLYIEFKEPSAASWLLANHPLCFKNARLNISAANGKKI